MSQGLKPYYFFSIIFGIADKLEKSDLIPKKQCSFLGMIIDSKNMTIELPLEKRKKIKEMINELLSKKEAKL